MRHMDLPFAIGVLAATVKLGPMLLTLVGPTCAPNAFPARILATTTEAVSVAVVAAGANDHLLPAARAVV